MVRKARAKLGALGLRDGQGGGFARSTQGGLAKAAACTDSPENEGGLRALPAASG
jgi:hypothetical protein